MCSRHTYTYSILLFILVSITCQAAENPAGPTTPTTVATGSALTLGAAGDDVLKAAGKETAAPSEKTSKPEGKNQAEASLKVAGDAVAESDKAGDAQAKTAMATGPEDGFLSFKVDGKDGQAQTDAGFKGYYDFADDGFVPQKASSSAGVRGEQQQQPKGGQRQQAEDDAAAGAVVAEAHNETKWEEDEKAAPMLIEAERTDRPTRKPGNGKKRFAKRNRRARLRSSGDFHNPMAEQREVATQKEAVQQPSAASTAAVLAAAGGSIRRLLAQADDSSTYFWPASWMHSSSVWQGLAAAVQVSKEQGLALVMPTSQEQWAPKSLPQQILDQYYSRQSLQQYAQQHGVQVVDALPTELHQECIRQLHAWRAAGIRTIPADITAATAKDQGVLCIPDATPRLLSDLFGSVDNEAAHRLLPHLQLAGEWQVAVDKFEDAIKTLHDTTHWLALAAPFDEDWLAQCSRRECVSSGGGGAGDDAGNEGCRKELQQYRCQLSDADAAHLLWEPHGIPSHAHILVVGGPEDYMEETPIVCSFYECLSRQELLGEEGATLPSSADSAGHDAEANAAFSRAFADFHVALRAFRAYGNVYSGRSHGMHSAFLALGRNESFFWLNPQAEGAQRS